MDRLVLLSVAGVAGLGLGVGAGGEGDVAEEEAVAGEEEEEGELGGLAASDVSMLAIRAARRAISAGGSCSRKTKARNSRMCLEEKSSQDWADMLPK